MPANYHVLLYILLISLYIYLAILFWQCFHAFLSVSVCFNFTRSKVSTVCSILFDARPCSLYTYYLHIHCLMLDKICIVSLKILSYLLCRLSVVTLYMGRGRN